MSKPQAFILRSPGTNCDQESAHAFELAGAKTQSVHLNRLVEAPELLKDAQILCLPGGFSFGDDIAAGRILASQMQSRLGDAICEFRDAGKLVLGICNGFQVLIKSGFLLPLDNQRIPGTLTWNDSGRFMSTWVHLKSSGGPCVFLRNIEQLYLPIAHAEGKFVLRDETILAELETSGQLALKYCPAEGGSNSAGHSHNPNGSVADVAGMCDPTGRIFGLMPHPERFVDPTHHPRWTRQTSEHEPDGLAIFKNAVGFFE